MAELKIKPGDKYKSQGISKLEGLCWNVPGLAERNRFPFAKRPPAPAPGQLLGFENSLNLGKLYQRHLLVALFQMTALPYLVLELG